MNSTAVRERPLAFRTTPEGLRVAAVFRDLREQAGLTQEDIAHRVDLTLSGYRAYEQGRRSLKADQVGMFAQAFGVSRDALWSRLGLIDRAPGEVQVSEDAELLSRLAANNPDAAATVRAMVRQLLQLGRDRDLGRDN